MGQPGLFIYNGDGSNVHDAGSKLNMGEKDLAPCSESAFSRDGIMGKRVILVVEDDGAIRQGIVDALHFKGYDTLEADNGRDGLDMAVSMEYDLLLLDLVLPGRDGLDILQEVRSTRPTQPVIILTARGAESDRVRGLKLGADDYVVKPFSVKELLARVEAVLRRSPERPTDVTRIPFPGGVADLARREVRFEDGERSELSPVEVNLLRHLARNTGRAISRDEILSRVWRLEPGGVETRTIDMHIARLRKKLRDHPPRPQVILTVRGKGYMLAPAEDSP
jgi:DNA-binding response OmpR family regulator